MKKRLNSKLLINIALVALVVYAINILYTQQNKLSSYNAVKRDYKIKIEEQTAYKESLLKMKSNVNSQEYIEQIAREKLDMYLPNERVYIDIGK